jgi:hypothetical protein
MAQPLQAIESFVSDVLLLAYNAVWSLALLAVRPLRTAHRLYFRLQHDRASQIAPHSLLFLAIFASSAGYAANRERLPEIVTSLAFGEKPPPEIQHLAIAAAALLVAIDLLVRSAAVVAHGRDRRRQERFVKLALYVFCSQVIYVNVIMLCVLVFLHFALRNIAVT